MNKTLLTAAMAGLFAVGMAAGANAADGAVASGKVKCYGIAKAGKNACASANGSHSCAGMAKTDNDPNEWIYAASSEACATEGGKLQPAAMTK
jgi:uncharacterized membrane protein